MSVAEGVYRLTRRFPREEVYGMTAQVRRAAVSVAANIAEGYGRNNRGSFVQFLHMSQGSLKEVETHLALSMRVNLAGSSEVELLLRQCDEFGKMLLGLIRSVQRRHSNG